MNRIRRLRCHLACLPRSAGPLAAFAVVAAARSRWPDPPFPPGWKLPPGWNNYLLPPPDPASHPPLPLGHVAGPVSTIPARILTHTAVTGGMSGWQIALITATTMLLPAAVALAAYRTRSGRWRVSTSAADATTASRARS
jgi:hypothetical protein